MIDRTSAWRRGVVACLVLTALMLLHGAAHAHPHVWVTMKSELIYAADGSITGVRHAWTFDDMFSTYATQGIESKQKGVFTREELKELAEINVSSLKEYDYFTYAKLDGRKSAFVDPVDYWLEYKDERLTLHFMLPLKTPAKAGAIELEIYDPSYFVDFSFAEKEPFILKGAAADCKVVMHKPGEQQVSAQIKQLGGEAAFTQDNAQWGQLFANKVAVRCP